MTCIIHACKNIASVFSTSKFRCNPAWLSACLYGAFPVAVSHYNVAIIHFSCLGLVSTPGATLPPVFYSAFI